MIEGSSGQRGCPLHRAGPAAVELKQCHIGQVGGVKEPPCSVKRGRGPGWVGATASIGAPQRRARGGVDAHKEVAPGAVEHIASRRQGDLRLHCRSAADPLRRGVHRPRDGHGSKKVCSGGELEVGEERVAATDWRGKAHKKGAQVPGHSPRACIQGVQVTVCRREQHQRAVGGDGGLRGVVVAAPKEVPHPPPKSPSGTAQRVKKAVLAAKVERAVSAQRHAPHVIPRAKGPQLGAIGAAEAAHAAAAQRHNHIPRSVKQGVAVASGGPCPQGHIPGHDKGAGWARRASALPRQAKGPWLGVASPPGPSAGSVLHPRHASGSGVAQGGEHAHAPAGLCHVGPAPNQPRVEGCAPGAGRAAAAAAASR